MDADYLLQRLGWTLFAAALLLSGMFFAVALTPDPNNILRQFQAASALLSDPAVQDKAGAAREVGAAYLAARNRDVPLLERYWHWMSGYATLKLGYSYAYEAPVTVVLGRVIPVTAAYLLPGLAFAWVTSLLGGLYASLNRGGLVDRVGGLVAFVGLGVPPAIIVGVLSAYSRPRVGVISLPTFDRAAGLLAPPNLAMLAIAAAAVGFSVTVVQWPIVRSEATRLQQEPFVRTLRADGAGPLRVARHLAKNATAPLLELLNAEVLVVLLLTIYVLERFLYVPGLGLATLFAFHDRDVGLLLATVMLPAFVGLLGNLLSDLVAGAIDPRVSD